METAEMTAPEAPREYPLIADGLHPFLEEWKYRKDPAVAVSDAKELRYSAAHFFSKKFGGYRPEKSSAQNIGTLVHLAVLEPDRFSQEVILDPVDAPKRPTKAQREAKKPSPESIAAIEFWDNWERENGRKTVVSAEELAQVNSIRDSILSHPDAGEIIENSDKEVAMFNTINVAGYPLRIKGKADLIGKPGHPFIADIKTVDRSFANAEDFSKAIEKWAYHMQAAWYIDLYNSLQQKPADEFSLDPMKKKWIFIVAEKEPPFAVCTLELDDDSIAYGREENYGHKHHLAQCFSKNNWPGPPTRRGVVSLPKWRKKV